MKIKLESGATGFFNEHGEFVCTGSSMGRRNDLPECTAKPVKLALQRLRIDSGGYDSGGAYWGIGSATSGEMFVAFVPCKTYSPSLPGFELTWKQCRVFTRARGRAEAKQKIRAQLPAAKFYR